MRMKDRQSFHQRFKHMVDTIRDGIYEGQYKNGDFLPAETRLMELYSLGKHSVRSALEVLVKEGLIEKVDRVGTRVCYAAPAQITLRFGLYPSLYEEANLKEIVAMFHQENPHIKVELIELPYHQVESVKSLTQLGIFDVLTVNTFDFNYFKDQDGLDLLEQQVIQPDRYPFLNDLFSVDGRLMLQPIIFSPVIMCYNKKHLREQRLFEPDGTWTWEDLRHLLRQLKETDRRSIFFHLSSVNRWPIFLMQQGVKFNRNEEGRLTMTEWADGFAMLSMLRDLVHEEGLYPLGLGKYSEEDLFLQEKVSVIFTTYFKLNRLRNASFSYDIAQLPQGKKKATLLLSTGIAIYGKSSQKEAARCLMDFLASERIQSFIRKTTFSLPANKWIAESVETDVANKPQRAELYRETVPYYSTHEQLGLTMGEILIMGDCLKQYLSKLIDEQELLAMLTAKLNMEEVTL